ncbi:MAG: NAD-dependent epimerase/dehydratase family protein [Bacteroidota bacterium]|nr:NAD-dependent epimerase/dehydratase family protein [Bacteroidota bacterium]
MKIVITGASGFIGGSFLKKLLSENAGHDVICLSSSDAGQEKLLAQWPQLKVFALREIDSPTVLQAMNGADTLIHFGWSTVPRTADADPRKDLLENVYDGVSLIGSAGNAGIGKFIFLSSGGTVYGNSADAPFREDHATRPVSAYGISKLTFEHYLRSVSSHNTMQHVILRPGNIYGRVTDPLRPQGVIEHWMHQILRNDPVHVWGNTDVVRDYVHVDDLVKVLMALLEHTGEEQMFNVGTGIGTSLAQLIQLLKEVSGREFQVVQNSGDITTPLVNILNSDRLRDQLGFAPDIQLGEGLKQLWNELLIGSR